MLAPLWDRTKRLAYHRGECRHAFANQCDSHAKDILSIMIVSPQATFRVLGRSIGGLSEVQRMGELVSVCEVLLSRELRAH